MAFLPSKNSPLFSILIELYSSTLYINKKNKVIVVEL